MANILHFAEHNGQTISFNRVDYRKDGAYGFVAGENVWVKCNRKVEYKSNASRHECDDRCYNATGRAMKCECACGGKNHGRGAFNCSSVAA
jgi:hypothetical protein